MAKKKKPTSKTSKSMSSRIVKKSPKVGSVSRAAVRSAVLIVAKKANG